MKRRSFIPHPFAPSHASSSAWNQVHYEKIKDVYFEIY